MQLASRFASHSPALRSAYPLSDDQMSRVAPSIFAEAPHESRSQRYSYIPTATVLQELRGEGFEPFMVCQTRVRADDRREYTKHMIRLRLVLPDTSSIALDKLPGIDPAGYAGLGDGVDWHWSRILAGAALSTLLGANAELAVSNQNQANGNTVIALRDSAQDTINQIGQEITRRNLSIQPTLTVRPGFQVNVMVNKDLVLRPYQLLFIQRGPMP
ncbi:hypothetical protein CCAE64S_03018 [Castellaniella caeni]